MEERTATVGLVMFKGYLARRAPQPRGIEVTLGAVRRRQFIQSGGFISIGLEAVKAQSVRRKGAPPGVGIHRTRAGIDDGQPPIQRQQAHQARQQDQFLAI